MTASDHSELAALVTRLRSPGCPEAGSVTFQDMTLEYLKPRPLATALELLYGQRIYDVEAAPPPKRIIDGGSWIGLSIIRFHQLFPDARIIGFEPDPQIFAVLRANLQRNGAGSSTELVPAALAGADGPRTFTASGTDAGSLTAAVRGRKITVDCVRTSDYLDQPGTLLKLNIEGAECEVLEELGEKLQLVDHALIEYHGFAELPQSLHRVLAALDAAGLTYVISHFNERNRACVPPLHLTEKFRYFLLIFARRVLEPSRKES